MIKTYEKNPLSFAIIWAAIYCGLQTLGTILSPLIGIYGSANAILSLLLCGFLLWWLHRNDLMEVFGLNLPLQPARNMLYYVPLAVLVTGNLWHGAAMNLAPAALVCHVTLMLCAGFLEELIFRGFLYQAIAPRSRIAAVLVSAVSYGLGHLLNLLSGSGAGLADNLLQLVMTTAFGFLFVMICLRSGSLIPCMLGHAAINILSAFVNTQGLTLTVKLIINGAELVILAAYLLILRKTAPFVGEES